MIEMHDGDCQPFTINRDAGREVSPGVWNLSNGVLHQAQKPLLGWRVAAFAYDDDGIFGAGGFRPSPPGESPFGDGINSLPPARCRGMAMLRGRDGHLLKDSVISTWHQAPHPHCTCGYRIVHDVKDIVRFYHRHRDEFELKANVPDGLTKSVAVFAVRGGGRVCRSVEFRHFNDPVGTIRAQFVSAEAIVLLDQADAHTASMFEDLGFEVHILDDLTQAHEAERCGSEYQVKRVKATKKHALRLSAEPGRDGGTYFTRSGEWGSYGAAGVLLKTAGEEPRYLLQQRAHSVSYGGMWSIPGGARHQHETPGETAARELSEEMGISDFAGLKVTGAVTLQSENWVYHSIIAECSTRPAIQANSEVAETAWLTRAEILDLAVGGKLHPLFEAALHKLLNRSLAQNSKAQS